MAVDDGYGRTVAAIRTARDAILSAINAGRLKLPDREAGWLKRLNAAVDNLPETESDAVERASSQYGHLYHSEAYEL